MSYENIPDTDNLVCFGAVYKIKSVGHGTVLDDWAGAIGKHAAALQPDDTDYSPNRAWTLVKVPEVPGGFRNKSVGHGTVLDDWGGDTGQYTAALQPDDVPTSTNRIWKLVKVPGVRGGFRIKSVGHETVLDDWGKGQKVVAVSPFAATIEVAGMMKADFATTSTTIFKRIGDI